MSSEGPVDVVVTGAAGFIGSALVPRLMAEGMTVQGVDLRAAEQPTMRMDITDGAEVMATFQRLKPRLVVHAAALVDERARPEELQRVNVGGTQNVLDAACTVGVSRFVHTSSITAAGADPGQHVDESYPLALNAGHPYYDTKAASEELVREACAAGRVDTVVIRPGDVYGPGAEAWVLRPLAAMDGRLPVLIRGGRGLMAHAWIDNVVDGLLLALTRPEAGGRVFHVHDGSDDTTYRDYFTRLAQAAGMAPPRAWLPYPVAMAMAAAAERVERVSGWTPPFTRSTVRYLAKRATYSIEAAREVLGYAPAVDLDEGMERLAAVFRK